MPASRAELYFHTLRHIPLRQISAHLMRKIRRPRIADSSALSMSPAIDMLSIPKHPSLVGPSTFRLLNKTYTIQSDWNPPEMDRLWIFNLHYFDDLNAKGSDQRTYLHEGLIDRWIHDNPIGLGFGWESYPISLRAVNWIKWHWRTGRLSMSAQVSLAQQARYLFATLETHLGGNHLLANAKALIFLGIFFEGHEANVWLEQGCQILREQLPIQVLADGGHFERSPMYQALLVEDLLELLAATRQSSFAESLRGDLQLWSTAIRSMLKWLAAMCHGDGEISFFNDSALGLAPAPNDLLHFARQLKIEPDPVPEGLVHLSDSGYVRMQIGEALLLADVGAIGPDELLGHAHADTLSFEFSIGTNRLLTNSGTSTYWDQELRDWQRGTASHNSVCIDSENSSQVWSRFRVAQRARPYLQRCDQRDGGFYVEASHDGYRRLPGRPEHKRVWELRPHKLRISDTITGHYHHAVASLYLHPDVKVESVSAELTDTNSSAQKPLILKTGTERLELASTTGPELKPARFFPEFGRTVSNQVVLFEIKDGRLEFELKY